MAFWRTNTKPPLPVRLGINYSTPGVHGMCFGGTIGTMHFTHIGGLVLIKHEFRCSNRLSRSEDEVHWNNLEAGLGVTKISNGTRTVPASDRV